MNTNYLKLKDKSRIIMWGEGEVENRYETLNAGIYEIGNAGSLFTTVYSFEPISIKEGLVSFKSGSVGDFLEDSRNFFSEKTTKVYKQLQVLQKMGVLFYGPPGTGKTCTALIAMKELSTQYNAICLITTGYRPNFIKECINAIRKIQDNPIVVLYDEVEGTMSNNENEWLSFLDGTDSVDRTIIIGCTNYLKKIPKRIRERKSRIKHSIEIKSLPYEVYKEYISSKCPEMDSSVVAEFCYKSMEKGLTIDEVKHALIDYCLECGAIEEIINSAKQYGSQEDWDDQD